MKKLLLAVFFVLLSFCASVIAISFDAETLYESVAIVETDTGIGTGFAVDANYFVTNAHVVEGNKNVVLVLYDGDEVDARVIKVDTSIDLALLRTEKEFVSLKLDSTNVAIGQEVFAIGTPSNNPFTMTKGIVSALKRNIDDNYYIQIDASVNAGNSGGPLVDSNGTVLGMVTLKEDRSEGIGFAIYADTINTFCEDKTEQNIVSDDSFNEKDYVSRDAYNELKDKNLVLSVALVLVTLLLIVLSIVYFKKNTNKKIKSEYDFEIEIQ